jgi:hypothetical protein
MVGELYPSEGRNRPLEHLQRAHMPVSAPRSGRRPPVAAGSRKAWVGRTRDLFTPTAFPDLLEMI